MNPSRNEFTPARIASAGRRISAPFGLILESAHLGVLDVETILRLLPGKRLTAIARWHGKRVLIKLFVDPGRWQAHWQEEMSGHEALVQAHIATPRLLNSEQHDKEQWGIAVYEFVTQAHSADQYWLTLCRDHSAEGATARNTFLQQMADVTATLHQAGLIQWDNHLDNFLVKGDRIIVIDSGGVCRQSRLSPAQSTANLALLAAQFPCLDPQQLELLRTCYLDAAGRKNGSPTSQAFLRETQHQRRIRLRDYIEKCQRECTDVVISQPRGGMFMAARRALAGPELEAWAQAPSDATDDAERIKDGNSQTVVTTTLDGLDVVIKRYNIKNVGHWLRRLGRTSRARNAWTAANAMRLLKLPTPRPVAMIEQAVGPLHGPAWFIAERCAGRTLDVEVRERPALAPTLASQMRNLCDVLICHRISHGDFKASNFIVGDGLLWVIDLDAVQFHGSEVRFAKAFRKDLERFMRNWDGQPELYNTFFEALSPLFTSMDSITRTHA